MFWEKRETSLWNRRCSKKHNLTLSNISAQSTDYIGFYTENILISFDNERLHTINKKYMRKQRKLINWAEATQDTNNEETPNVSGTDDVSEISDQQNEKKNNEDDDDNDNDNDNYDDISSTDDTSHSETSDNNNTDNDDERGHVEDLYYNQKRGKWTDSDEDN